MRRFRVWLLALAILLLAGAFRYWGLMSESPGFEEIAALQLAKLGPLDFLHAPHIDQCPPLFYLLLKPLTVLGSGLWAARIISVAAGALAAMFLFVLGRHCFGDRAALIGGFMLAINPLHAYYCQEATPVALATVLLVAAVCWLVRSAELGKPRHWIIFDAMAVALLHLHRAGALFVVVLLLCHLFKVFFFPNQGDQRRVRKGRMAATVFYNYLVVVAISMPWLIIMPGALPWHVEATPWLDLLRSHGDYFFFGVCDDLSALLRLIQVVLVFLLLPPLARTLRGMKYSDFVPVAALALSFILLALMSRLVPERYLPGRDSVLAVPFFALLLGLLLGRCNPYVRSLLFGFLTAAMVFGGYQQVETNQKLPWGNIATTIKDKARPGETIVFWPDFTADFGRHYLARDIKAFAATDFFQQFGDTTEHPSALFAVTQFPMKEDHLYTFPGALKHYSNSEMVWHQGRNYVIRARDINMSRLRLWYNNPDELNILDQPTSDTAFLFSAADPIFRNEAFYFKDPATCYDLDGRRCVWTRTEHTELKPDVTLAPGAYVLKIHCSPVLDQPEFEAPDARSITVNVRTGEERTKLKVAEETTIKLRFSTDTELRKLPIHIEVNPMLKVDKPDRHNFGLKIYSIAIDQDTGSN
ncbi:MAG: glycosyltransferase family 39 protein [Candidatus Sumerlaeaceae bacterium]|nr:glycosyltransferase family 39 protein [Candidatus Sumerlaeaceae bacterium]